MSFHFEDTRPRFSLTLSPHVKAIQKQFTSAYFHSEKKIA